MVMKKIAVVTTSRADYGLLYLLLKEIQHDPDLELQIVVTGMHLSPEFGMTYKFIEKDGFIIHAKVEMLISSDSAVGVAKSMGVCMMSMAEVLAQLKPDLIVILGDRFETLAVAQVALVLNIPLAHIHGGELTEAAIDNAIRHAITKMAHLHFVCSEPYKKRVIQMGETPATVFNVGTLALDRISKMKLLGREEWQERFNFSFARLNFLVTFHPVTLKPHENQDAINALLSALDLFPQAKIIFTKANSDEAGRTINSIIHDYVNNNCQRAALYDSLGDMPYISLLQFIDVVIGNSSSGLIEPSFFKKPTVNVGERQAQRLRATSVIDCSNDKADIHAAITQALSSDFQKKLDHIHSEYGKDNTATKIKEIIKNSDLNTLRVKPFYDVGRL